MKKLLFSLCMALLSCIAFAQTNVVVVLKNGTNVKYAAEDIDSIRIEKSVDEEIQVSVVPFEQSNLSFNYLLDSTAIVRCLKDNTVTEVIIPDKVLMNDYEYTITGIGKDAFLGSQLENIKLSNSVTKIGERAFWGCTSLKSIKISDSLIEIGDGAFIGCTSLTSIEIPNSVKVIKRFAFQSCENLTSIEIPISVTEIGEQAFNYCFTLKTARVPKSLKGKVEQAFDSTCEIEYY